MSLRFQSALTIDNLPDEQIDNQFEVIMPTLDLVNNTSSTTYSCSNNSSLWAALGNQLTSYTPIVEEIVFGVRNFKTNTRRVRTGWCNIPEDIQNYQDVAITMFVSSGMLTQYYLSVWKSLVFNNDGEYYNPMITYKKNIEVYFFGPGNIGAGIPPIAHFTLQGCFPYSQDPYKLSYKSNPQRLRITANFKVDKIITNTDLANSSITAELLTSPTSLIDKAITTLSESATEYSISDVYG